MPTSQMTVYQEREGLSSKMPFINQVTGRCSQKYCLIAECDNCRECGVGSVDSTISQTLSEERQEIPDHHKWWPGSCADVSVDSMLTT